MKIQGSFGSVDRREIKFFSFFPENEIRLRVELLGEQQARTKAQLHPRPSGTEPAEPNLNSDSQAKPPPHPIISHLTHRRHSSLLPFPLTSARQRIEAETDLSPLHQ